MKRIHLPFLLLALVGAMTIKISVHEALQLTETTFNARLQYELPGDSVILVDQVEEIKIRLRGPSDELAGINPFSVAVKVRIQAGELGTLDISEDRMQVSKPGDFEVLSFEPNRFQITLEERLDRSVPIRVVFNGEPAAGATPAGTPTPRPDRAEVTGPRSRVERVSEIIAFISLDGHAFSFEEAVTLVSPDPLVRVVVPTEVLIKVPMDLPEIQGLLGTSNGEDSPS